MMEASVLPLAPSSKRMYFRLFALSFAALFLELMVIRWVPAVVRMVAYYANLMLISSFLGLGLGAMIAPRGLEAVLALSCSTRGGHRRAALLRSRRAALQYLRDEIRRCAGALDQLSGSDWNFCSQHAGFCTARRRDGARVCGDGSAQSVCVGSGRQPVRHCGFRRFFLALLFARHRHGHRCCSFSYAQCGQDQDREGSASVGGSPVDVFWQRPYGDLVSLLLYHHPQPERWSGGQ